jgi:hypothetical protein
MAKDSTPPATRSGESSSGSDFGAKISDVKEGVVTLDYVKPKNPEPPVRH